MADSLASQLRQDMQCEGLLECLHGLKQLDKESYRALVASTEPLTIDEIAERVDRERSTAYRSIQRLLQAGLVQQDQINYDSGSYYHVYRPTPPEQVADDMQHTLNEWYAKLGQLIHEFEEKYADQVDGEPVEPSSP